MVDDTKRLHPRFFGSQSGGRLFKLARPEKFPVLAEPETREDPPGRDPANVREAQRIIGELVWVSTRTRPDLSYCHQQAGLHDHQGPTTGDPTRPRTSGFTWLERSDQGLQFQNDPEERQL